MGLKVFQLFIFLGCFSLISFLPVSWAAQVLNKPIFQHCSVSLKSFLVKNADVSSELLESKNWSSRFVVHPDIPLQDIYSLRLKGAGSLIELQADSKVITISVTDQNQQKVWLMNQNGCLIQDSESVQNLKEKSNANNLEFDDRDLSKLLKENPQGGVIYFWSPHMVLSVEGIQKIEEVCKKLSVPLMVLLDSEADQSEADDAFKKYGLKKEYLKKNISKTLVQEASRLHYPNISLYKNGTVLPVNLSGYKSSVAYEKFIGTYLRGGTE